MANAKILLPSIPFFLLFTKRSKKLAQPAAHVPNPVFHEVFHLLLVRNKERGSSLVTELAHLGGKKWSSRRSPQERAQLLGQHTTTAICLYIFQEGRGEKMK